MKNAIEWFKEHGFSFDDKITIRDVLDLQEDALRHAARLAEKVGEHLRQDDPSTGEPREGTPTMAEGAFMAASRICLEADGMADPYNGGTEITSSK